VEARKEEVNTKDTVGEKTEEDYMEILGIEEI